MKETGGTRDPTRCLVVLSCAKDRDRAEYARTHVHPQRFSESVRAASSVVLVQMDRKFLAFFSASTDANNKHVT